MQRWTKQPTIARTQKSIFDQADRQAVEGMELSYRHAPTYWKEAAREALHELCRRQAEFTTDELWEILGQKGVHTGEPRALGAIIKGASRAGLIVATGKYVASGRRHNAPITLWASNIFRETSNRTEDR